MSNKREPLLSDKDDDAMDWLNMPGHVAKRVRAALDKYEAARAKDADLIQRLVNALDGLVEDRGGIIVAMRRSHKALDAAKDAGFKPSDE